MVTILAMGIFCTNAMITRNTVRAMLKKGVGVDPEVGGHGFGAGAGDLDKTGSPGRDGDMKGEDEASKLGTGTDVSNSSWI